MLLLPAAVGSFSFAAIQQAIKNPARGGASEYQFGWFKAFSNTEASTSSQEPSPLVVSDLFMVLTIAVPFEEIEYGGIKFNLNMSLDFNWSLSTL